MKYFIYESKNVEWQIPAPHKKHSPLVKFENDNSGIVKENVNITPQK